MPKIKFIDNEEKHNQVLYDLRLLDDDDNYPLFCEMQTNEFYDFQEFPIDPEVEQYIIEKKLYDAPYNSSYEYVYVKNKETNEIHIIPKHIYINTGQMLTLEQELTVKDINTKVNKI